MVFLRDSSGFFRGFRAWDVFVFNVLGYATGLSLATNPTILGGLYPNSQIYWVLIFGLILSIFCGLLYGIYSAWWPRNGGDYLYIGRTLHPAIGFVANWGFTWSQIYGIGVFCGWAIRDSLSPAFTTFGYSVGNPWCINAGAALAHPVPIFLGGCLLLLLCLVISVSELPYWKGFVNVLFGLALLSSVLMIYSFFSTDHAGFVARFNAFIQESTGTNDGYDRILSIAEAHGLQRGRPATVWDSFRALPVGFLIFFGFTYSVYVGGEVREPQKSQAFGIIGALTFAFVASWLGMGRYFEVVGRDFNNAVAIVKSLSPPENPLPAGGSMIFFSGVILGNPVPNAFMTFGSFLWFFLLPIVMTKVCINNIFAWAFDRVLPPWFAHVTPGNVAWPAAISTMIPAAGFLALDSLCGFPYINYITLFSVCFFTTGISGTFVPFIRRDLFAPAPPFVRRSILGIPLISIAGLATTGMFAIVIWSALMNNDFSGVQAGFIPHAVLAGVYGAGLLWWLWRRRRGGIDPHMLFLALPPE